MNLLRKTIRPEFLNRIDELIMFRPLSEDEISEVVRLQLNDLVKMLEKTSINLTFTDKAIKFIAIRGFDPQYGARPVKRVIQRMVLNELSKKILSGEINRDATIVLDAVGEKLVFQN